RLNELHERPRWYNAITDNCTSAIRHQQVSKDRPPWDWRMLVNGYGDRLLYQRKSISQVYPFEELKKRSLINERAKAANNDANFSEKIRVGLPALDAKAP
ncbi:MAG: DUF4105 domain-containing protein, partial [Gloeobacteraceae cyanobacterium ES-bin-144]|nr:DUF4105 domain-containing protein [Verrucomicrobiales bacterium]